MKEIVLEKKEFDRLTTGRIHYCIEQEPIYMIGLDGKGKTQTGEFRLIALVTGISKDNDPKRVIMMKINLGVVNRYQDGGKNYASKIEEAKKAMQEEFPKATEGAFE